MSETVTGLMEQLRDSLADRETIGDRLAEAVHEADAQDAHGIPDTDGIHPGVLDLFYLQWDAVSNSRLTIFERSPAHYKAHLDNPPEPGARQQRNFDLGSAVHMAVLQPDEFEKWFVLRPPGRANSNAFKAAARRIRRANPWARMIHPDDWDTTHRIRDAVHANPAARYLLDGAETELSITWTEPEKIDRDPIRGKARVDFHNPAAGVVGDLKTCMDARADAFGKHIENFRYYRQAAWYLRGCKAVGIDHPWVFMAVEKVPPYELVLHEASDDWIVAGEDELEPLLDRYARCLATDTWPGYRPGVRTIWPTRWQIEASKDRAEALTNEVLQDEGGGE